MYIYVRFGVLFLLLRLFWFYDIYCVFPMSQSILLYFVYLDVRERVFSILLRFASSCVVASLRSHDLIVGCLYFHTSHLWSCDLVFCTNFVAYLSYAFVGKAVQFLAACAILDVLGLECIC